MRFAQVGENPSFRPGLNSSRGPRPFYWFLNQAASEPRPRIREDIYNKNPVLRAGDRSCKKTPLLQFATAKEGAV
jgi:hypothetical protein